MRSCVQYGLAVVLVMALVADAVLEDEDMVSSTPFNEICNTRNRQKFDQPWPDQHDTVEVRFVPVQLQVCSSFVR